MKKPKLPSIPKIKKALYADWSLRVRARDGFKCLLCGATENITAHHWYVSDHHAHAARYAIANGATLCYACHIRGIHSRADFVSVKKLGDGLNVTFATMSGIDLLIKQELTTPLLREFWDAMRKRPVEVTVYSGRRLGKKEYIIVPGKQIAVPCNVLRMPDRGEYLYEVAVVTKTEDGYRYTLKKMEDGE